MKIIVTEKQYGLIQEQILLAPAGLTISNKLIGPIAELKKKYPIVDTLAALAMWFIPYVGPYLSATYSSLVAVTKIKEGKTAEGIIELITSPLALMKTVKVLQIMGGSDDVAKMLQIINKTGLPVLVAEGQEAFLKWGYKTFGKKFETFLKLLIDEKKMKELLSQLKQTKTPVVKPVAKPSR
jgi:hypothetical protein